MGELNNRKGAGTVVEQRSKKKPRRLVYQLRLNDEEAELLDMISYETEDTKADVFRKALKTYANIKRNPY